MMNQKTRKKSDPRTLSPIQQKIWMFIKDSTLEQGYPPTLREIGDRFNLASTNGVRYHLRQLAEKGFLEKRQKGRRRGLKLLLPEGLNPYTQTEQEPSVSPLPAPNSGAPAVVSMAQTTPVDYQNMNNLPGIPLLGHIAAGIPINAEEHREAVLGFDPGLFQARADTILFALKIKGDSMSGSGILEGDIAVVRQQNQAHSGQVVAALIDGEATIKRLRTSGREIWLEPENLAYRPIKVSQSSDFRIAGLVIGIIRCHVR